MDVSQQNDVRWKQRYENFSRAFAVFERMVLAVRTKGESGLEPTETEYMALIQSFEVTFELGWKTLSDILHEQGYIDIASPRGVIKQAFSDGIIVDGEAWLRALLDRNATTHIYDEKKMREIVGRIDTEYFLIFQQINAFFAAKK